MSLLFTVNHVPITDVIGFDARNGDASVVVEGAGKMPWPGLLTINIKRIRCIRDGNIIRSNTELWNELARAAAMTINQPRNHDAEGKAGDNVSDG